MEEALMDHRMLRRLVLEQRIVNYVGDRPMQYPRNTVHYFDCGENFDIACVRFEDAWMLTWVEYEDTPKYIESLTHWTSRLDDLARGE